MEIIFILFYNFGNNFKYSKNILMLNFLEILFLNGLISFIRLKTLVQLVVVVFYQTQIARELSKIIILGNRKE